MRCLLSYRSMLWELFVGNMEAIGLGGASTGLPFSST